MKTRIFVAVAAVAFTLSSCNTSAKNKTENNKQETAQTKKENKMKTIEMNETMFKEKVMDYATAGDAWNFKGDKPAIIDFYATWCGPCKATAPILEEIAQEYDGKIDVYKVDVDKNQELSALFNIRSIAAVRTKGRQANHVGRCAPQSRTRTNDKRNSFEVRKHTKDVWTTTAYTRCTTSFAQ